MVNNVLSYILSLIGIKPIIEQNNQELLKTRKNEELCEYLSSSNFMIILDEKKEGVELKDWLSQVSKMTLYQILTSAIADYPQIADRIQTRHYKKNIKIKNNIEQDLIQLKSKVKTIAHALDNARPSEQFAKASETTHLLTELVKTLHMSSDQSFHGLFSFIILAKESLLVPSEVRQHVFYHTKFGRILILEISAILKNFKFLNSKSSTWSTLYKENWFLILQDVCTKLSRYDVTWEYRQEYYDVITMAERLYHQLNPPPSTQNL